MKRSLKTNQTLCWTRIKPVTSAIPIERPNNLRYQATTGKAGSLNLVHPDTLEVYKSNRDWCCTMTSWLIDKVMMIESEFVPQCKQWRYELSSRLWLLRLSLYRGVNNDIMNNQHGYLSNLSNHKKEGSKNSGYKWFKPAVTSVTVNQCSEVTTEL